MEPIISADAINEAFWSGLLTGVMMVVKEPMFIVLVAMLIGFNIIKSIFKKKK